MIRQGGYSSKCLNTFLKLYLSSFVGVRSLLSQGWRWCLRHSWSLVAGGGAGAVSIVGGAVSRGGGCC